MKSATLISTLSVCLLITSCVSNDEMLTVINPDGSCYRAFTRNADSAFMTGDTAKSNPFPIEIDENWKITWTDSTASVHNEWPVKDRNLNTGSQRLKIMATARRDFNSVQDMAENFRFKKSDSWRDMKPVYTLDKKFRWFYTYYTYKENYPKVKTFDKVDFSKYMTNEEAEFWFTGKPDLLKGMNGVEIREYIGDLENKYNMWFGKNVWDIEFEELLKNYDSMPGKPVDKVRLVSARDSIFEKYYADSDHENHDLDMEKSLNSYFKTTKFSKLWENENSPMKKFEKNGYNLEFINLFGVSYEYKLMLPGKIIQPNNAILHGDTLVWKLDAYRMVYSEYAISAQSRKANVWAFILSALVVVTAVFSYFYKLKR
jgi:hypothetical protein